MANNLRNTWGSAAPVYMDGYKHGVFTHYDVQKCYTLPCSWMSVLTIDYAIYRPGIMYTMHTQGLHQIHKRVQSEASATTVWICVVFLVYAWDM